MNNVNEQFYKEKSEYLESRTKQLEEALKLLITEIDVIEMIEDTNISDEAYSRAVNLLTGCDKNAKYPGRIKELEAMGLLESSQTKR